METPNPTTKDDSVFPLRRGGGAGKVFPFRCISLFGNELSSPRFPFTGIFTSHPPENFESIKGVCDSEFIIFQSLFSSSIRDWI